MEGHDTETPAALHDFDAGKEKKSGRFFAVSLLIIAAALVGCFMVSMWIYSYSTTPGPSHMAGGIEVVIPTETGFTRISTILAENGVVRDDIRFRLLAGLMGVAHRLKAGEYSFEPCLTPYEVLCKLEEGKVVRRLVTIPEGVTVSLIADILADEGRVDRNRFFELVHDTAFIKEFGIKADSLEGYLFPDTYHLEHGQTEESIIRMMVARLREMWSEGVAAPGKPLTFSRHEILTLASIVEKETARPEERVMIASVFLNRLKRGMRLQTDPTVIYGLAEFDGNLTRSDLKKSTPYNTYLIKGLPPGPIASPGLASIEAVIQSFGESSSSGNVGGGYLYFVSMNDGSGAHHFSRTLKEHNRAVARFQKRN
ncbi:MAG: endolytic transglycosylase MltG [Desulfobulbaceae bacterium]|nr:endolytic transglycosylase MltG [Desulfobulbaceae bacterium]